MDGPGEIAGMAELGWVEEGSKKAMVLKPLRRKDGATLAEFAKATDWQNHTCPSTHRRPPSASLRHPRSNGDRRPVRKEVFYVHQNRNGIAQRGAGRHFHVHRLG